MDPLPYRALHSRVEDDDFRETALGKGGSVSKKRLVSTSRDCERIRQT